MPKKLSTNEFNFLFRHSMTEKYSSKYWNYQKGVGRNSVNLQAVNSVNKLLIPYKCSDACATKAQLTTILLITLKTYEVTQLDFKEAGH